MRVTYSAYLNTGQNTNDYIYTGICITSCDLNIANITMQVKKVIITTSLP